jgi:hypothetical protein
MSETTNDDQLIPVAFETQDVEPEPLVHLKEIITPSAEVPGAGPTHQLETEEHEDKLREWVLKGLAGAFLVGIFVMSLGQGLHWTDSEFAKAVQQSVLSPLIAAGGVIIGYLFGQRRNR